MYTNIYEIKKASNRSPSYCLMKSHTMISLQLLDTLLYPYLTNTDFVQWKSTCSEVNTHQLTWNWKRRWAESIICQESARKALKNTKNLVGAASLFERWHKEVRNSRHHETFNPLDILIEWLESRRSVQLMVVLIIACKMYSFNDIVERASKYQQYQWSTKYIEFSSDPVLRGLVI